MKNALGKKESLNLYNDKGVLVYKFYQSCNGLWSEIIYDDRRNELSYKNSLGDWYEYTRDDQGNPLTYKNCHCYWYKKTYDDQGNELTYKDSEGKLRGFDIPEYTMEQLTEMIGKEFKIKK